MSIKFSAWYPLKGPTYLNKPAARVKRLLDLVEEFVIWMIWKLKFPFDNLILDLSVFISQQEFLDFFNPRDHWFVYLFQFPINLSRRTR